MPKGNWVDRGDALEKTVARVLAHALGRDAADAALTEHVLTLRGLVEAGGTEVHVRDYLRLVCNTLGAPTIELTHRRTLGIAIWHIVKVGLVRDAAERDLAAVRRKLPPEPSLAVRLEAAIRNAPVRTPFVLPSPRE